MEVQQTGTAVLLIEDDDIFLRACTQVLTRAGFAVDAVADPLEGIERAKGRRYDVVVSDIRMPNADGLAVLRAVRQLDPTVPFVLMTGAPSVETAISAVEHGAMRYLPKPFEIDVLVAVVREAVAKRAKEPDPTEMNRSLDRALATLWMAYQPIVRWSSRAAVAFEALVRCNTPEVRGPPDLLALAEQTRRLHELGRAIRSRVASDFEGCPDVLVFVNLHPNDLEDVTLYDGSEPLSRHAPRVVLEITERASVAHLDELPKHIEKLRKLGYRIAIDDLGAGYAGLTTFARVEPEFVKLDGSLIRDVDGSQTRRRVVKSVVEMAKELRIEVVAEAIETPGERKALTSMGLDLMQGYYFARPEKPWTRVAAASLEDDEPKQ